MSSESTKTGNHTIVVGTGASYAIYSVAFHPDGMYLLSGSDEGVRRWRVVDGQEVGKQTRRNLTNAISVSRDWMVCGTSEGASVWDAKTLEKTIEVEGTIYVGAVDISPDSTRFATGTGTSGKNASIWDIKTGERLLGPLQYDNNIAQVKFSPNGEHIAIVIRNHPVCILDSRNGDQLITINASILPDWSPLTPLAWLNNGKQIFAASAGDKIEAFDVSTGSQLAEVQVHNDGEDREVVSIALAPNGKFLATFASSSISFWDTSTLVRIGPVIVDGQRVRSIALSSDCSHLATGGFDGNITIRNLSDILPDSYGPFRAPNQEHNSETSQDGPGPSTDVHNSNAPDSTQGQPSPMPNPPRPEAHSEDGENDLLEAEVPTSEPAHLFDFDEPPSPASSAHVREVEVMLPEACQEEHRDTAESSGGIPAVKRWLQTVMKRGGKSRDSDQPYRLSGGAGRPANHRSRLRSQAKGNTANEGPSRMAAGQRVPRAVAKPVRQKPAKQPKTNTKATEAIHPNKDASSTAQGHGDPKAAGSAQQVNDASQPSAATGIHVTEEAGDARVSIAFKLPGWMCCVNTGTEAGRH